jgi:hypothetical protein
MGQRQLRRELLHLFHELVEAPHQPVFLEPLEEAADAALHALRQLDQPRPFVASRRAAHGLVVELARQLVQAPRALGRGQLERLAQLLAQDVGVVQIAEQIL